MKLIVGLGNPGKEYEKTRHNVGWLFIEYIAKEYGFEISKKLNDSLVAEININGEKVIFAKPQTFMNLSGIAVQKLKNWYKLDDSEILIVFDDIDIDFGMVRFRQKGSAGTHNGMKNIVQMLSSNQIPRIKIGIGNIKHENQPLVDFVLEKFTKEQLNELETNIFNKARENFKEFLDNNQKKC